jgi:hypothetical protein
MAHHFLSVTHTLHHPTLIQWRFPIQVGPARNAKDSTIWQRTGRIDNGVMSVLLTDPLLSPILVVLKR